MPNHPKEPHAKNPRKLTGQASKGKGTKKKDDRWQARVRYYDSDTGKRREISQTIGTKPKPNSGAGSRKRNIGRIRIGNRRQIKPYSRFFRSG